MVIRRNGPFDDMALDDMVLDEVSCSPNTDNQQRQLPILAVWVTNMIALPTQAGEKTKILAEHNASAAWHQTYKPTLPS